MISPPRPPQLPISAVLFDKDLERDQAVLSKGVFRAGGLF
jgi:hypothetical protein